MASTALTTPCTTISVPSTGTTTGLVNRVPNSTTRPESPAQSATTEPDAPMVHIPCAMTSGRPTDRAKASSWWMGFWSPEAFA